MSRRARLTRRLLPLIVALAALIAGIVALAASGQGTDGTRTRPHAAVTGRAPVTPAPVPQLPADKAVGQLVIATYPGSTPPAALLTAVQNGHIGSVILLGANTAGGVAGVRAATRALQAAAHRGGNPGVLVMTDQEGGEVSRLSGPPDRSAAEMGHDGNAASEGAATARLLRSAGVNVDLAPVADVSRIDGFMTKQQRTFGSSGAAVATAACAFARGLARGGVAYTLKHFPGLGDAVSSTDGEPVAIREPLAALTADDAAYRQCGSAALALVMVSSASYPALTGGTPAVLSPTIYRRTLPADHVTALPISDSFQSGAISHLPQPALRAVSAGLDLVMYPDDLQAAGVAYRSLLQDAQRGRLPRTRLDAADARILALKRALGLAH